jgi:arabinofuranosyltransferase
VLAITLFGLIASRAIAGALAAAVVAASFIEEYDTYDEYFLQDGTGIETIHGLRAHLDAPDQAWAAFGRELGRAFDHDGQVTIAVGAAGAVPYYSELRTIDMFGLNDAWIARHGIGWQRRPGHRRLATMQYLLDQHVNLSWSPFDPSDRATPADTVVVHVPLTPGLTADLLYLVRSPRVDAVIQREGWRVTPVRP